jgi:hypothetical protein
MQRHIAVNARLHAIAIGNRPIRQVPVYRCCRLVNCIVQVFPAARRNIFYYELCRLGLVLISSVFRHKKALIVVYFVKFYFYFRPT